MYELSVAFKYLIPRWRQLSVSVISIISILVIALVVWLIVVFFSVTNGLEQVWTEKMIALTSPVRVTPTQTYYDSYYYKIDSISENSGYSQKSIREKRESEFTDPYDPTIDEEIPSNWTSPVYTENGELKDLVKLAYQSIDRIPDIVTQDYEMTISQLRINFVRNHQSKGFLNQGVYLGSFEPENPSLEKAILPKSAEDIENTLSMINDIKSEKKFFDEIEITQLKTPPVGWRIPPSIFPKEGRCLGCAIIEGNEISRVMIPNNPKDIQKWIEELHQMGISSEPKEIVFEDYSGEYPIFADGDYPIKVKMKSLESGEINFASQFRLQNLIFEGLIKKENLQISEIKPKVKSSFWLSQDEKGLQLPQNPHVGDGLLLPRSFKDAGVFLGDRGYLSYYTPTTSSMQEQRVPIFVAGFFDPGIMPVGGKFVIAPYEVTSFIRSMSNQEDTFLSNGIHIRFDDLSRADQIKEDIIKQFKEYGITPYWKVETYKEYDFTKDLIQQLQSDKHLFTLIATVIIIVACSNIISMLIILVNDKKVEIGILRAMGATSKSIAMIFGLCGLIMGTLGSMIGVGLGVYTLRHLQHLVDFISYLQGHEAFNPIYYGNALPNQVSYEALIFVTIATILISLLAGIVPAVKACLMKPAEILRSE